MSWKLRAALSALLLAPQAALALGLGDIRLNSGLNEPLAAEIDLVAPTADELSTLSAQLASRDLFQRYGLDRPGYLDSVRFSVGRGRDGRNVLMVSSAEPMAEPFVTFLVEVNWPRGRLLREYTVLLDPPVFAAGSVAPPAPVVAPRVTAPAAPRPAPAPQPPAAEERPPVAVGPDGSYQVSRGDTLTRIATQLTDGSRDAKNRMMIALFRANPDAFAGNINVLKAGATLRVPGADEVQSVGAAEATNEIGRQMGAWRSGEVDATPGRLRLVTPAETAAEPLAPDASASEIEARIESLNRDIGDSQRMLELRSAELAELQERLARERAAAAAVPAAPAPAEPAAPAAEPGAPAPEAVAPAPEPAEAAAPPAPKPAPEPARKKAPAAAEPPAPSFVDSLTDNWTYILGAAVLLLGGGLAYGYMRRRREQDLDEALRTFDTTASAPVPSETMRLRAMALAEEEEEEKPQAAPQRTATAARAAAPARGARAEDTISAEGPAEFDQADPLAEADFHMAYGLYDQAADIVKLAQGREPGRTDLKLKLLEIYFVSGNKPRFLDAARQFDAARSAADAANWDRVVIMGRQLAPEDPMFLAGRAGTGAGAGVDLNLAGGEGRVDLELLGPPVGDEGVDLDLGQALAGISDTAATGENQALDFDLAEEDLQTAEMPRAEGTAEIPTVKIRSGDAPTIESTRLDAGGPDTLRSRIDRTGMTRTGAGVDSTAEMSIDDLGIDLADFNALPEIPDEDDVTLVAPLEELARLRGDGGDQPTAELPQLPEATQQRTALLPEVDEGMDFDLGDLAAKAAADDPGQTMRAKRLDIDIGGKLAASDDASAVTEQIALGRMPEMSELEPVTMSEVGTKLDLARAYVDMGDPDGARSILEEVLKEGSTSQRQEARRLIDALPGA